MPPRVPRDPRQTNWKNDEEEVLCQVTMSTSEDPITGTNQAAKELWEHISAAYEATKPSGACSRSGMSCMARWKKICPACMRWLSSLNHAIKAHGSGENEADQLVTAKREYHKLSKGEKFSFFHCWEILKTHQKFMNPPDMDFSSNFEPPIDLDEYGDKATPSAPPKEARSKESLPMGNKAAKAAKKKKSEALGEIIHTQMKRLNDLRERELAHNQQLLQEAKAAEKIEADDRIMTVDPSIYTPKKRAYWERRQKNILEEEKMVNESSTSQPNHTQSSSRVDGND